VDVPLALTVTALVLLVPASAAPLMSISSFGAQRDSWLPSGVRALWNTGFESLAIQVAAFSIVLPFIYLGLLIWVLGGLHFGADRRLGRVFRWATYLRPWAMLDVYLVGCFVAFSRLEAIADVDVGLGGWCLIAATFSLLLALTQLDDRTVWEALPPQPTDTPGDKIIACTVCDLIVGAAALGRKCPRCGARLHGRKPNAIQRTAAFVVAGYLLYIPANVLPVLHIVRFGRAEHNTIMSGVFELLRNGLWPLALIVFTASIILPLMKLCGLTWMLLATRLRSSRFLVGRTRLYRVIDLIGRWSNIDVFMVSVLVALLQFGALTAVQAGDGLVAFAAVVVITMLATIVFDARLMWDAPRSRA
jgi:paraquat-inducible protein A